MFSFIAFISEFMPRFGWQPRYNLHDFSRTLKTLKSLLEKHWKSESTSKCLVHFPTCLISPSTWGSSGVWRPTAYCPGVATVQLSHPWSSVCHCLQIAHYLLGQRSRRSSNHPPNTLKWWIICFFNSLHSLHFSCIYTNTFWPKCTYFNTFFLHCFPSFLILVSSFCSV